MSMQQPPHVPIEPHSLPEVPGATAGLVLGILSLVLGGPIIGLVLAIIGFAKAKDAKAMVDAQPGYYSNAGVAQAGYILSIIGICVGSLSSLCGCGWLAMVVMAIGGGAAGAAGGP